MNEQHTNRLINETSPYLLQHAHNPVDWFAWGDEALQKARSENKLLLISIGYSACHWCHVMEHESFENSEVAEMMNASFVCIKVDREERPDIDQVYMDAVQLLTGHGGWPLNCFALPDGKPVYGGTYYRKNEWKNLLHQLSDLFKNQPDRLYSQARAIQEKVILQEEAQVKVENIQLSKTNLQKAIHNMSMGFDLDFGGFNGAPKFPMPSVWLFLLHYLQFEEDQTLKRHLLLTLDQLVLGGIYDHAGGGFSRYSVDKYWHIPHFEKMLYDNAQLVSLYSEAFTLTQNEHYKRVVYKTLSFVRRELTTSDGAFYSALDADSEGEEGKYYAWAAEELKEILGNDYPLFAEYYSVTDDGNWENGVNVLKAKASAKDFSVERNLHLNDFLCEMEIAETKLMVERNKRFRPGLDDKIIASWNALMLKGYIDAYRAFKNETFLDAALKNARFIKQNLIKSDFSMHRTFKNGTSKINGFLDDYSFTIAAYIDLYQVTFAEEWLLLAKNLTDYALTHFYDHQNEFFFYTSDIDEKLVVRKKELTDNVIPSSNSCMAGNLLLLSKYFGESNFANKALTMIGSRVYEVEQYARFYSNWGDIMLRALPQSKEIVITGPDAAKFYSEFNNKHSPNLLFAVATSESEIPIFAQRFVQGKTLIYVCMNNTCKLPIQSVSEALALIRSTDFE